MKANNLKAPTVVCVLRSGGEYQPKHVWALLVDIEDHWPAEQSLRKLVLTDMEMGVNPFALDLTSEDGAAVDPTLSVMPLLHGWQKWWAKMELFRPALDGLGDFLFFDLDTVVVGDLQDIADTRTLTVLTDFYWKERMGSGLMYIPASERPLVWKRWASNPQVHLRNFRGDQEFLNPLWEDKAERWQDLVPGQVVSYKVHVQRAGGVPEGARVVCFHGRPRPWQVRALA